MSLVRGPFDIQWGANTLTDVSEISLDFEQESNEYTTVDNRRYSVDGAINATVSITLLASDVPALAVVLPQYFVPQSGTLSTGESVTGADGAIDVVAASCDSAPTYASLVITGCGSNAQVFRLVNARTKIDSMEFADNAVRTVTVQFIGEPESGDANIQFFAEDDVVGVS